MRIHPATDAQIQAGLWSERREAYQMEQRRQLRLVPKGEYPGDEYWYWYGQAEFAELMRQGTYTRMVREANEANRHRRAYVFTKRLYSRKSA